MINIKSMKKHISLILIIVFAMSMLISVGNGYLGGCVMDLPFNEGTGTTAYDETGNGNDGAITDASWTTGQYGAALSFDGSDKVTITHTSALQPSAFTISLWAKPSNVAAGARALIGKETAYLIRQDSDDLVFYVYDGTDYSPSLSASNVLAANTWIHIVATATATTQRLYINGEEASNSPLTHVYAPTGTTDLTIGVWSSPEYFVGSIDEVQFYSRALSESEVQSLYTAQQDVVVIGEETSTLYMRSDLYSVNNETAYGLDSSNTASNETVTQTSVTDTIYFGFRIFLLNQMGYTREVTSGTPVAQVSRAGDGVGVQTNTYSMTETKLTTGAEALMIKVYTKVGAAGSWAAKATFLSNQLLADTIDASTWTFSLYTNLTGTTASFKFGSSSAESKITGISMTEPDLWGYAMYYFHSGNYVMFFFYPYTRLIGMSPFVSIIMFGIGLTVYVRFRNFYFLLLVLVMLSIGGVLQFIMGDALMGLVALVCTFALAGLYWKVFR